VLSTILSHIPEHFDSQGSHLSERFAEIYQEFRRPEFLEEARSFSSALEHHPPNDQRLTEGAQVVSFTTKLIKFFQEPEMARPFPEQRRIEFQLTYYILKFLDENYRRMLKKVMEDIEQPSRSLPDRTASPYAFRQELEFRHST
jgi:hypothetical protein